MAPITKLASLSKPSAVVRLNLDILHWMGFWPRIESVLYTFYNVCFYLIIIASITLSMIAGLVVTLSQGQFQAFLENVCITLTNLSIAIKLLMLWQRRQKVAETLEKLDRYVGKNSENHLIIEAIQDGHSISCIHIFFCIINITIHGFAVMLETGNVLPFPAYYPIDYSDNFLAFVLLYLYQFITVMSTGTLIGDMDTFPVGILRVVCGQLDSIGEDLRSIGHKTDLLEDEETDVRVKKHRALEKLKNCIRKYQEMVELAADVEEIFAGMIFMQAILSVVVLCVSVFQRTFVNPTESIGSFLKYCYRTFYVFNMCRQIYFPCYHANELTIKSELMLYEAYRSQWFQQDEEYKMILKIFMERIKTPIRISAMGMLDINLQTFLRICNSAYSLYAVLDK